MMKERDVPLVITVSGVMLCEIAAAAVKERWTMDEWVRAVLAEKLEAAARDDVMAILRPRDQRVGAALWRGPGRVVAIAGEHEVTIRLATPTPVSAVFAPYDRVMVEHMQADERTR
jgi:hypothetical protein